MGYHLYKARRDLIDMTGERFGRLVVTHRAPNIEGNANTQWFCKCDCGTVDKRVSRANLRARNVKSCGCILRERQQHEKSNLELDSTTWNFSTQLPASARGAVNAEQTI